MHSSICKLNQLTSSRDSAVKLVLQHQLLSVSTALLTCQQHNQHLSQRILTISQRLKGYHQYTPTHNPPNSTQNYPPIPPISSDYQDNNNHHRKNPNGTYVNLINSLIAAVNTQLVLSPIPHSVSPIPQSQQIQETLVPNNPNNPSIKSRLTLKQILPVHLELLQHSPIPHVSPTSTSSPPSSLSSSSSSNRVSDPVPSSMHSHGSNNPGNPDNPDNPSQSHRSGSVHQLPSRLKHNHHQTHSHKPVSVDSLLTPGSEVSGQSRRQSSDFLQNPIPHALSAAEDRHSHSHYNDDVEMKNNHKRFNNNPKNHHKNKNHPDDVDHTLLVHDTPEGSENMNEPDPSDTLPNQADTTSHTLQLALNGVSLTPDLSLYQQALRSRTSSGDVTHNPSNNVNMTLLSSPLLPEAIQSNNPDNPDHPENPFTNALESTSAFLKPAVVNRPNNPASPNNPINHYQLGNSLIDDHDNGLFHNNNSSSSSSSLSHENPLFLSDTFPLQQSTSLPLPPPVPLSDAEAQPAGDKGSENNRNNLNVLNNSGGNVQRGVCDDEEVHQDERVISKITQGEKNKTNMSDINIDTPSSLEVKTDIPNNHHHQTHRQDHSHNKTQSQAQAEGQRDKGLDSPMGKNTSVSHGAADHSLVSPANLLQRQGEGHRDNHNNNSNHASGPITNPLNDPSNSPDKLSKAVLRRVHSHVDQVKSALLRTEYSRLASVITLSN